MIPAYVRIPLEIAISPQRVIPPMVAKWMPLPMQEMRAQWAARAVLPALEEWILPAAQARPEAQVVWQALGRRPPEKSTIHDESECLPFPTQIGYTRQPLMLRPAATCVALCLLAGCAPSPFSHWLADPPAVNRAPPSPRPEACQPSSEPVKPTGHTPPPEASGELRVVDVRGDDRFAMAGDVEMVWSSDGERIIAATNDGVLIWRASTGELERHIDFGTRLEAVRQVLLSPDETWIVVVGRVKPRWDKPPDAWIVRVDGSNKPRHQPDITDDAWFLTDGRLFSNDNVWDLATGARTPRMHVDAPVAYLPDGGRAFVYVKQNGAPRQTFAVELRELVHGKVLHHFGAVEMTMQTSLSEDGRRFAVLLKNGELSVYSTDSFERVAHLPDVGNVRRVKLSPDGHRALVEMPHCWTIKASGGQYDPACVERTMSVWDLDKSERLLQADPDAGNHWRFTRDGEWLRLSDNIERKRLIHIQGGKEVTFESPIHSISPDLRRVILNTRLGYEIASIDGKSPVPTFAHSPRIVARSRDGRQHAAIGRDKFVRIESATSCVRLGLQLDSEAHQVNFSADGLSLLTIPDGSNRTFRAYDTRDGTERWAMQTVSGSFVSAYLIPNANMVLFDNLHHRDVLRFDATTGKPLPKGAKPPYNYQNWWGPYMRVRDTGGEFIDQLAAPVAARNGLRIASESGSSHDCSVAIWNLRNPGSVEDRPSGCGRLYKALSPDEKWLALGEEDGRIRLLSWQGDQSHFVAEKHSARITSILFTPTSHRVISASQDGHILMADPRNGQVTGRAHLPLDGVKRLWISPDGRDLVADTDRGLEVRFHLGATDALKK